MIDIPVEHYLGRGRMLLRPKVCSGNIQIIFDKSLTICYNFLV